MIADEPTATDPSVCASLHSSDPKHKMYEQCMSNICCGCPPGKCQEPKVLCKVCGKAEGHEKLPYSWELEQSRFVGVNPALLRERADWQAAFLATRFGPEALTGLAVYFGQLGEELVARMLRRDRETARVVAEQDADRREKYPAAKYPTAKSPLDVFE